MIGGQDCGGNRIICNSFKLPYVLLEKTFSV